VGFKEVVEGAKISEITIKKNGKKETIHRKQVGKFPKHELVTSHICRRSFATNLYGKIDTLTIMKITGHKTESQFLSYIKITPKEYAEKLKECWKNSAFL
jgi:integrase